MTAKRNCHLLSTLSHLLGAWLLVLLSAHCSVVTMDFSDDPNEDLADVIGDESGLAMEFESDRTWMMTYVDNEERLPRRNSKPLVRNRLVNSLANCLEESKYDKYVFPGQLRKYNKITLEKVSCRDVHNVDQLYDRLQTYSVLKKV